MFMCAIDPQLLLFIYINLLQQQLIKMKYKIIAVMTLQIKKNYYLYEYT